MSDSCFGGESRQKSAGVSLDPTVPVEWLHPKDGRHINSLDSLLYHEDLVRDYLQGKTPQKQKRAGKEIIEKALFEKDISKWEGVVSDISSDWKGVITLKKRIYVPFVPVNVSPHMPNEGDVVRFCLAFHWTGPCAWYVVCQPGVAKAQKAAARSTIRFLEEDDTNSETSDKDDEDSLLPLVGESLHMQTVRPQKTVAVTGDNEGYQWSNYLDCERQGIIFQVFPSNGYGFIHHPDFKEYLFFHKKQIVPPVENLSSIEVYSVVLFTVGKTERGLRAMNIRTVVCYFKLFISYRCVKLSMIYGSKDELYQMPIRENLKGLVKKQTFIWMLHKSNKINSHSSKFTVIRSTGDGFGRFWSVLPNVSCRLFVSLEACDQWSLRVYAPSWPYTLDLE